MVALIFFIVLQIADGLFTYHGINAIGVDGYESNPILVYYMHRFGVVESIFAAKTIGSLIGYLLYKHKTFNILWLLIGLYLYNFFVQIEFFFRYYG